MDESQGKADRGKENSAYEEEDYEQDMIDEE